jgi:hypothetical protein
MTTDQAILKELSSIRDLLTNQQSDYADQERACMILGFFGASGKRKLTKLRKKGLLQFSPGRGMVYEKKDLYDVAKRISEGHIII